VKKHYDVIVLGRSIGALAAAALLARRDFTVLVLGHGDPAPSYSIGEHTLHRRAFTFLSAASPAWKRVLAELAQTQTWKRRTQPAEPMLQAIAPGFRLDVPSDQRLFGREINREFPELHHVVEQLYEKLGQANGVADEAFESDVMWPPRHVLGAPRDRQARGDVALRPRGARRRPVVRVPARPLLPSLRP
jgi:phytoene dehydrogenase-like protein